jgi:hypothetical protein
MNRLLLLTVVASAATLIACGSDTNSKGGGGGSGGGAISSPSEIGPALWGELCDATFNCSDVSPELVLILGRYGSAAECRANYDAALLDLDFSETNAAIADGRASFDSAATTTCLQRIQQSLCSGGGFEDVPECEEVIVGLVEEGGNCNSTEECAGPLRCDFATDACYGVCSPNCGGVNCAENEFCGIDDVCTARVGVGESCNFDSMCSDGLFCDFETNTCATPGSVSEGGVCGRNLACADGLVCIDGQCLDVEFGLQGDPCSFGDGSSQACSPGLVCTDFTISSTGVSGSCAPPKPLGGQCRIFFECEPELTCSTLDPAMVGECVERFADGAECSQDFDCSSGNCDDGLCAPQESAEVCQVP